jgi:hypothetical protein
MGHLASLKGQQRCMHHQRRSYFAETLLMQPHRRLCRAVAAPSCYASKGM